MSRITCQDFQQFFDAYIDGEFDERDRADFDAHLASCPDCRSHYEQRAWFLQAMRPALRRPEPMPAAARDRLRTRLRGAQRPARVRRMARKLAVPVPTLAAVGAAFFFITPLTGFVPVEEAVDQHCKDIPVEVPSDQAAEVDRWFKGKVRFDFQAPRFNDAKAVLLGGRLSRVPAPDRARDAGLLIYGVGPHKVSVLVFDGRDLDLGSGGDSWKIKGRSVTVHDKRGYRVALYQKGDVGYAVTSDLPANQMKDLIATSF